MAKSTQFELDTFIEMFARYGHQAVGCWFDMPDMSLSGTLILGKRILSQIFKFQKFWFRFRRALAAPVWRFFRFVFQIDEVDGDINLIVGCLSGGDKAPPSLVYPL